MTKHVKIMSIAQWSGAGTWRAELPHSHEHHALIWITRGQGRCMVEGVMRGLSVHTALCVPARTLFSLDMGKQGFGTVCTIPARSAVLMPDQPVLLRIRDVLAQVELTTILETMQREQSNARPFADEAMMAHAALLTVWLRRAIIDQPEDPPAHTAAQRLVMAYAALVERDYTTGKPMSDYARILGVTPTHLTRACRASAGMTPAAAAPAPSRAPERGPALAPASAPPADVAPTAVPSPAPAEEPVPYRRPASMKTPDS
ncbi:AraC family transcriptional regulator [Roseovarius sp.]|uniref:AraC family transcriptional regulator n=1 Tax=Roseovarius sp. TaxID=1486281 RepID=UPI003BAB104C